MNPNDSLFGKNQEIDRTFVEGSSSETDIPIRTGSGTSIDAQNPYTRVGGSGSDGLPTGNDPVPIGSGTIAGVLGSGGMARIYKIWNEKLEVYRAVKILFPNQQKDLQSRFETEAKITAKLHHPNIVEIYNVGEWNSLPFLEMELIDGESLDKVIHRIGRMPASVCSAISIFVARALAYAHKQEFLIYGKTYQGIIHRDLKPANVMISQSGEIKLMDFGIARPTETSLHTVEGNIVGTLQYLSPEQMDGVGIDRRTDLYSFGAILYEMLTGTKTFPQNTITNLMKMKAINRYRSFEDFNLSLPPLLVKIAQKCLEPNKEDRFSDASALLKALERAHRTITQDSPEEVLKAYIDDPDSFDLSGKRLFSLPKWAKFALPAVAAAALVTTGLYLYLGHDNTPDNGRTAAASNIARQRSDQQTRESAEKPMASPDDSKPEASAQQEPAKQPKKTDPAPQAVKRSRPEPVVRRTRPAPAPRQSVSPLEKLKKEYGESDLLDLAAKALSRGKQSDALLALDNLGSAQATSSRATLLFLEAYVTSGQTANARDLLARTNLNDAWYDLLAGRLEERTGNQKKALNLYQTALTKPSEVRSRTQIRNDALFFTAQIYDSYYRNAPSAETRLQALNAWNVLKRCYLANPQHPRFKIANEKLATIK